MSKYIIAIDQGTTSSRTLIFDLEGNVCATSQKEFSQIYPELGWVEHNADEIWETQLTTIHEAIKKSGIQPNEIKAIGITNQRETTVIWDKNTGKPIYNAIVWQDRRTASICEDIKNKGLATYISENTGLVVDAYFSGTKIKWLLDNVAGAKDKSAKSDLLFGTIDTWLLWKLTQGKVHATDYTNASRTMLFNIRTLEWDKKLVDELTIPQSLLPVVKPSSTHYGYWEYEGVEIPITGIAGDQQAALFGQTCFESGMAKNTYGTGCFMLMNTGSQLIHSKSGLLTTLACGVDGKPVYALEGSVFIAGAAIQWLKEGLELIKSAKETDDMAQSKTDTGGVYVVPAFVGLGTPYWDMYARGAMFGLTRDTDKGHIVRATLESLAYQTRDVLDAMQGDSGIQLKKLQVDGGVCGNNFLMQFQADILNVPVERPKVTETTAQGAYYLAALGAKLLTIENIRQRRKTEKTFIPNMPDETRTKLYKGWKKAVERTMNWEDV